MRVTRVVLWAGATLATLASGGSVKPALSLPNGAAGIGDGVDFKSLVSRADLDLTGPVQASQEGIPIGNGRMGTLIWTEPTALHTQINRVDVFGNNKDSDSFPQRYSDYCGGCGFVDVNVGSEVFTSQMKQHLSCYDALATLASQGVTIRALAWADQDVIALEVTDQRTTPGPIHINLRMLRAPVVPHLKQTATSKLAESSGRLVLTQAFVEGSYYCGSAVAVGVVGRKVQIETLDERGTSLVTDGGTGPFTVLVSSAAGFDRSADLPAQVLKLLDSATAKGFAGLLAANQAWWSNFWAKGFVSLHSPDGVADMVEQNYTYYLYLMASSSRGKYMTKFNGMIWITGGDTRQWGGQYWGANQSCLYNALFPTNRLELLDPLFDTYTGMYDSLAVAARQEWGSKGIYIPETVAFDGLAKLPDDIAAEMRDLYLVRKPWSEVSQRFLDFAKTRQPHSSRWNWWGGGSVVNGVYEPTQRPEAPFGAVTHIFSRGAKIAYQYWMRYEYTLDKVWLRDRAYPMLKGETEFYRNFPNTKKGDDGKYHIWYVNSNESVRGARDTDEEIASLMGLLPVTIKASEILGVDTEMRPVWKEFLDKLAPLPRSDSPEAAQMRVEGGGQRRGRADANAATTEQSRRGRATQPRPETGPYWIRALPPIINGGGLGRPDGNTMPMWMFDLCTLENPDAETMRLANATLDGYGTRGGGVLSKIPVTNAMMGRADAVRTLLPNQLTSPDRAPIMANRMDQREGRQTTSAQRLGRAADALHNALLQSVGAGPGKDPVIRVFPAWPKEWDARFTLLARGGFLVSASMKGGQVESVQIRSQLGGECRLRNPWPNKVVTLHRKGAQLEGLGGLLLRFATSRDETIVVTPQ